MNFPTDIPTKEEMELIEQALRVRGLLNKYAPDLLTYSFVCLAYKDKEEEEEENEKQTKKHSHGKNKK